MLKRPVNVPYSARMSERERERERKRQNFRSGQTNINIPDPNKMSGISDIFLATSHIRLTEVASESCQDAAEVLSLNLR